MADVERQPAAAEGCDVLLRHAIAKLDHPNILPIYGYGNDGGYTYIVMRYVEAGTLREMMGRPPSPAPSPASADSSSLA